MKVQDKKSDTKMMVQVEECWRFNVIQTITGLSIAFQVGNYDIIFQTITGHSYELRTPEQHKNDSLGSHQHQHEQKCNHGQKC